MGQFILFMTFVHLGGHAHNYFKVMTADWDVINPVLGPLGSNALREDFTIWDVLAGGPTWTGLLMTFFFMIAYPCCSFWWNRKILALWRRCWKTEVKNENVF